MNASVDVKMLPPSHFKTKVDGWSQTPQTPTAQPSCGVARDGPNPRLDPAHGSDVQGGAEAAAARNRGCTAAPQVVSHPACDEARLAELQPLLMDVIAMFVRCNSSRGRRFAPEIEQARPLRLQPSQCTTVQIHAQENSRCPSTVDACMSNSRCFAQAPNDDHT